MTAFDTTAGIAPIALTPHPSEHSRLLLALSSTAIVFGGGALLVVGSAGWAALASLVAHNVTRTPPTSPS